MSDDLGTVLDRMTKREGEKGKGNLRLELLQWMDLQVLKEMEPKTWKDTVWVTLHRKKSTAYNCIQAFDAFGMMILVPVDGKAGDAMWDVERDFSEIKPSRLLKILKFTKGATEDAIEEWLHIANNASDEDFKKFVQEKAGKEVHDCGPFEEIQVPAWKCLTCGKIRTKAPDGDA